MPSVKRDEFTDLRLSYTQAGNLGLSMLDSIRTFLACIRGIFPVARDALGE